MSNIDCDYKACHTHTHTPVFATHQHEWNKMQCPLIDALPALRMQGSSLSSILRHATKEEILNQPVAFAGYHLILLLL
jgi:hypothetical protein